MGKVKKRGLGFPAVFSRHRKGEKRNGIPSRHPSVLLPPQSSFLFCKQRYGFRQREATTPYNYPYRLVLRMIVSLRVHGWKMCERYTSSQASLRGPPPPPPLPLPLFPLPSRPRHFVRFLHTKPCWKTEKGRGRKLFKAIFFSPFGFGWFLRAAVSSLAFFRETAGSAAHTETDFSSPKRGGGDFSPRLDFRRQPRPPRPP